MNSLNSAEWALITRDSKKIFNRLRLIAPTLKQHF